MISLDTFVNMASRQITDRKGAFSTLEYNKVSGFAAASPERAYFYSKLGVRKKQVIAELKDSGIILQSGAMQMMLGNVKGETNIQGAGDLLRRVVSSRVTGESAIKPKYTGTGYVVLEPTWKYIIYEDLADWGGSMTIDDGLFLACDASVDIRTVARNTLSSAALGGEGLFNTALRGSGIVALECTLPRNELIMLELENDTVKIDGNMAIAWSSSLDFTVERTTKTLIGSAASGEGLVNVYRGTGRVLMAP